MRALRLLALLAVVAISSPLVAVGLPACSPGPHCPMAAALGGESPCQGAAIEDDDCCVGAPPADAAGPSPVIGAGAVAADEGAPAGLVEPLVERRGARAAGPSPPLYRLFRTLLI